jgi:hypothetical protein
MVQRQVDKTRDGYSFLAEVADHELRKWNEFTESSLYAFMKLHFEKRIREIGHVVLLKKCFVEHPFELAVEQGRAAGYREIIDNFFGAVKDEHAKRTTRKHVDERADSPR